MSELSIKKYCIAENFCWTKVWLNPGTFVLQKYSVTVGSKIGENFPLAIISGYTVVVIMDSMF